jgi:hypothetical protein
MRYTTSKSPGARIKDAKWFGSGRRSEASVLLAVADVIDILGILLGSLLVLIVGDILQVSRSALFSSRRKTGGRT